MFYLFLFRRESGLESFVPTSLAESMKRKELKKLLGHFLKLNSSLTAPGNFFQFSISIELLYFLILLEYFNSLFYYFRSEKFDGVTGKITLPQNH